MGGGSGLRGRKRPGCPGRPFGGNRRLSAHQSEAGGLGALLDVDGDDVYEAGNFSQGLGYWYGTGVLWDGGGDDRFESVYFTQGSGAHFAIGPDDYLLGA